MAISPQMIQAGIAIGKTGIAAGKAIAQRIKEKKALEGGPSLTDPNMTSMANIIRRKRRALELGATGDRAATAREGANLTKASMLAGRRNLSDISQMQNRTEAAIAQQQGGALSDLLKQETGIREGQSKRKMDLVDFKRQYKLQDAAGKGQTAKENVQSSLPGAQEGAAAMGKQMKDGRQLRKAFRGAKKGGFTGGFKDFKGLGQAVEGLKGLKLGG
jgi:hypothetical protein